MITKTCKRKQKCCTVTYCPLIPAWATTIHKFQGFEAGFDENNQFKHLIVDPGELLSKQQNPGILYVAMSCAKTIGDMSTANPHPQNSAIFWTGSGICTKRVLDITKKRGLDGGITDCLKIKKRQKWIEHLHKQQKITSTERYGRKRLKKIEKKIHKKIPQIEQSDLNMSIVDIITNPNENWRKLKHQKYTTEKSFFSGTDKKRRTVQRE